MLIPANPPKTDLEPIEVSIRRERLRLQDIEFDTDETPSYWYLNYLISEADRGVKYTVLNF